MVEAYKKFWQNYANFTGRSRRSDYWYVVLANIVIGLVLGVVAKALPALTFLDELYSLVVLIPNLAVAVRRLHDIGKSGWLCLVVFIPLVGGIICLIWLATDSQPGNNEYGSNPKEM